MARGDRIEELLRARGWSQGELARRVGVSPQTIWKLVSGNSQGSRHLHLVARELGTTIEYLTGENDDPSPVAEAADRRRPSTGPAAKKSDTVELQEFDLAFGLGASFIHETPVTGQKMTFSRAWIRHFTNSPFDQLFWAHGIGDSMAPTIQDADVVLIDTAQRSPRMWDKLWALEMGGLGMIKRLRPTKDGSGMRLLSDAGLPEETAYDEELHVIGRVVAIVRKV